jgi:four helix bundle suffix protein
MGDAERPTRLLPAYGSYRELRSFQKAEVIYDLTFRFCARFLSRGDRTVDQMQQAARSGKQNIIEGAKASGTSKETELKLTNVARASLEELLADYEDFLRVRKAPLWEKDAPEALFVRKLGARPGGTYELFREFVETREGTVVANIALCLIHQANYLLDRQIRRLEADFLREGGIRERMAKARREVR